MSDPTHVFKFVKHELKHVVECVLSPCETVPHVMYVGKMNLKHDSSDGEVIAAQLV